MYISQNQKRHISEKFAKMAKEYEIKRDRKHPERIHKYNGYAFIDTSLDFRFKDGEPWRVFHGDEDLGIFTLEKRNDSDVYYYVGQNVKHYIEFAMKSKTTFSISVKNWSDGCFSGANITIHENIDDS